MIVRFLRDVKEIEVVTNFSQDGNEEGEETTLKSFQQGQEIEIDVFDYRQKFENGKMVDDLDHPCIQFADGTVTFSLCPDDYEVIKSSQMKTHEPIPADFPVQPLKPGQEAEDPVTCGQCGLTWDDAIGTEYTPAPSARCPFEAFHVYEDDSQPKLKVFVDGHEIPVQNNVKVIWENRLIFDEDEEDEGHGELHLTATHEGIIVDAIQGDAVAMTSSLEVLDVVAVLLDEGDYDEDE